MIEIKGLSKSFGDLTAVNDINLSVPKGEFFVILGPNAAGKTTTIKVMAGLMKPTSGSVHVCGHNIESEPLKARKRMAYLPDFPFLYDKLTPIEFFDLQGNYLECLNRTYKMNRIPCLIALVLASFYPIRSRAFRMEPSNE